MGVTPAGIVAFWTEAGPERWFKKDVAFDQTIAARFGSAVDNALGGGLDHWSDTPSGSLSLVLVLDQFTRNIWRDDARAFSGDERALGVAEGAIEREQDMLVPLEERKWLYMPFMHSERLDVQEQGLVYFKERIDDASTYDFAVLHRDIISRFGRFPHRNALLGRETTLGEKAFLDEGGFSG
ncbi:DUF924 domain-containing protein [Parvibaculaceae bacterium PLY_AMNH_Bact1]|nr:DUF924 domain-containing protein [Parvibaculaceae bacterium PLY_AMNH_Bact1]